MPLIFFLIRWTYSAPYLTYLPVEHEYSTTIFNAMILVLMVVAIAERYVKDHPRIQCHPGRILLGCPYADHPAGIDRHLRAVRGDGSSVLVHRLKNNRNNYSLAVQPIPGDPGAVSTHGCFHPDHAEVIRFFEKNQVYAVQIESCLSCSGGCRYCYASAQDPLSAELPAAMYTPDPARGKGSRESGRSTGSGEIPSCGEDWYELARAAQDLGLINNIWTSGIPLADPRVAHQVAEVTPGGFVSVHLDSLDEEIYRVLHTGDPRPESRSISDGRGESYPCRKTSRGDNKLHHIHPPARGQGRRNAPSAPSRMKGIRTCLTQICMAGLGKEHPEWVPSGPQIRHAIRIRDRDELSRIRSLDEHHGREQVLTAAGPSVSRLKGM